LARCLYFVDQNADPEKPPERPKPPRLSKAEIDEMAKNDPVIQALPDA
jgi:hypothetical protein